MFPSGWTRQISFIPVSSKKNLTCGDSKITGSWFAPIRKVTGRRSRQRAPLAPPPRRSCGARWRSTSITLTN